MPLYDFTCGRCVKTFEERRVFAQCDAPAICPACGASAFRVFATCAIKPPCEGWSELVRQDLLPDRKEERSHFTVPAIPYKETRKKSKSPANS